MNLNILSLKLIGFYKKYLSIGNFGIKICRFEPSCSSYAYDAYSNLNFFKATYLTLYRIIRCNPFSKGGYDPAPER